MKDKKNRRSFLRNLTIGSVGAAIVPSTLLAGSLPDKYDIEPVVSTNGKRKPRNGKRVFNTAYKGDYLSRVAFPVGGIGAGMFCLEGSGAISHMSVRHNPEMFLEPAMFAAISIKGMPGGARVLEGAVPDWKKFGMRNSGLGGTGGATWGLPRFKDATIDVRFPFAEIQLRDREVPVAVMVKGWSPFVPADEDHSSMPVGALEYCFSNEGDKTEECMFSYNARNFMRQKDSSNSIKPMHNGFVLSQAAARKEPEQQGHFAIFTNEPHTTVDHCWFRGGWFDPLTMLWNTLKDGNARNTAPVTKDAPGGSLFVPFRLKPGEKKVIRLMMAWYVPDSKLRIGEDTTDKTNEAGKYYKPWYSSRFKDIYEVAGFWRDNYSGLYEKTLLFTNTFYKSTLPPEVMEAVAANLTILKSATVMRQQDGRFWCWEGSGDNWGSCHGTCTHVWNYAQAVPHLFPALERSLRHTEFNENQNAEGHQGFRANVPISPLVHNFHAAADGQLGGIMKIYRDWRISGDNEWLKKMFPLIKKSLDYCIRTWDPRRKGIVEEPHHNTYDIEFWGPTGMCTSFYLGALSAFIRMGAHLQQDMSAYEMLRASGKKYMEKELYNGEFFIQKVQWAGLNAADPSKEPSLGTRYSEEAQAILRKEGPKYQYGTGCLSDGVLGAWIARVCGLEEPVAKGKVRSHLRAVYKYNLKHDLSDHFNPQRPTFALGEEGGLLLCSWPKGGMLSLPFVYSNEVWTGIEYQVASHLIFHGEVEKGLEIVRICRNRYDGTFRNPFNEYECGHWYARAMSSYGLLQALTGVRYDAVAKTIYIDSRIGDFTSFISTDTGYGLVSLKNGVPSLQVSYGMIPALKVNVSGREMKL